MADYAHLIHLPYLACVLPYGERGREESEK